MYHYFFFNTDMNIFFGHTTGTLFYAFLLFTRNTSGETPYPSCSRTSHNAHQCIISQKTEENTKNANKNKDAKKKQKPSTTSEQGSDKKVKGKPTKKKSEAAADQTVNKKKDQKVNQDEKLFVADKKKGKPTGIAKEELTLRTVKVESTVVVDEPSQTKAGKKRTNVVEENRSKTADGTKRTKRKSTKICEETVRAEACQDKPHVTAETAVIESVNECPNLENQSSKETSAYAKTESEKSPVVEHPHENDVV